VQLGRLGKSGDAFSGRVAFFLLLAISTLALAFGGGGSPFSMYAHTVEFRLDIVGRTKDGTSKWIGPSSLASSLLPSARPFVAGSDHFRRAGDVGVLRRHLEDLARLSCRLDDTLSEVDVTLLERADTAAPSKEKTARARCAP
jgi:hypothetical protein